MSATQDLKTRINEDMKAAMRAKQAARLGVIRLIMAGIKQREIDERIMLDDAQVIAVLERMLKQRRDSISQYQAANRQDLVDQEVFEVAVIQEYFPMAATEAEVDAAIATAVAASGAATVKDMGKVMAVLKGQLAGRADMGAVGVKVKARLGG